jgi:hypothetical protein
LIPVLVLVWFSAAIGFRFVFSHKLLPRKPMVRRVFSGEKMKTKKRQTKEDGAKEKEEEEEE